MSNKKVAILTIILAIIFAVVGFAGGFIGFIFINKTQSDVLAIGDLRIHFMTLGNHYAGDCILVQSGDTDILIDAGSRQSSAQSIIEYVDQYVQDNTLEFVIATHSDRDHIEAFLSSSSSEGIFEHYKVETIIDFPLTNKEAKEGSTLNDYYIARDNEVAEGAQHYNALECYNNENGAQRVYQISENVEMEILYNYYYENKATNENDYSVCLMFNQGENHYLFTGDLEKSGEKHLVDYYNQTQGGLPECVLYKAGHHGSPTSSGEELMSQIRPKSVVVCCCAGTSEYTDIKENQFPSQDFINHVAPYTDKIYVPTMVDYYQENGETKETFKLLNGNIVFIISGENIKVECSNNDLILKETDWFKENRIWPS